MLEQGFFSLECQQAHAQTHARQKQVELWGTQSEFPLGNRDINLISPPLFTETFSLINFSADFLFCTAAPSSILFPPLPKCQTETSLRPLTHVEAPWLLCHFLNIDRGDDPSSSFGVPLRPYPKKTLLHLVNRLRLSNCWRWDELLRFDLFSIIACLLERAARIITLLVRHRGSIRENYASKTAWLEEVGPFLTPWTDSGFSHRENSFSLCVYVTRKIFFEIFQARIQPRCRRAPHLIACSPRCRCWSCSPPWPSRSLRSWGRTRSGDFAHARPTKSTTIIAAKKYGSLVPMFCWAELFWNR